MKNSVPQPHFSIQYPRELVIALLNGARREYSWSSQKLLLDSVNIKFMQSSPITKMIYSSITFQEIFISMLT